MWLGALRDWRCEGVVRADGEVGLQQSQAWCYNAVQLQGETRCIWLVHASACILQCGQGGTEVASWLGTERHALMQMSLPLGHQNH
jgi:hypothetical protein